MRILYTYVPEGTRVIFEPTICNMAWIILFSNFFVLVLNLQFKYMIFDIFTCVSTMYFLSNRALLPCLYSLTDLNTSRVVRIRDSYANPGLSLGFA